MANTIPKERVSDATCLHDNRVRGLVVADPGDLAQFVKQRNGGDSDGGFDEGRGGDVEFGHHGAADEVD